MDINELRKHLVMTSCKEVEEICKPLRTLDIQMFIFIRLFPNGKRMIFCDDYGWNEFYISRFFQLCYPVHVQFEATANGIIFVDKDQYPDLITFTEASNIFNYKNGICLTARCKSFKEVVFFGSHNCNKIINNRFLNNIDILRKFISYFKSKASHLFALYNKCMLMTPKQYNYQLSLTDPDQAAFNELVKQVEKELKTNRYYIITENDETYFTDKELNVLRWLVNGKTIEETGIILNISSKTVESHLNHVKQKLDCTKFSQLSNKVIQLGII